MRATRPLQIFSILLPLITGCQWANFDSSTCFAGESCDAGHGGGSGGGSAGGSGGGVGGGVGGGFDGGTGGGMPPPFDAGVILSVVLHTQAGASKVVSLDGRIDCGSICSARYDPGTQVTLKAVSSNRSSERFLFWDGGQCPEGNRNQCPLTMDQSRLVDAEFTPTTYNLAFVTSVPFAADMGGVEGAATRCNQLATSAGIAQVTDSFVPWISDPVKSAASRLPASIGGFVRIDGEPFALSRAALISGQIRVPLNLDENGHRVLEDAETWTGTDGAGQLAGMTCDNWLLATGLGQVGRIQGGPGLWTDIGVQVPCTGTRRLICLEARSMINPVASPVPANGKRIYYTDGGFIPGAGTISADLSCFANRPQGTVGLTAAVLATSLRSAGSLLDPLATYYRTDGTRVGTGAELAAGQAPGGIWTRNDGTYVPGAQFVWTGATDPSSIPTDGGTCNDWTTLVGEARVGSVNIGGTQSDWLFQPVSQPCASNLPLICVEK